MKSKERKLDMRGMIQKLRRSWLKTSKGAKKLKTSIGNWKKANILMIFKEMSFYKIRMLLIRFHWISSSGINSKREGEAKHRAKNSKKVMVDLEERKMLCHSKKANRRVRLFKYILIRKFGQ